MTANLDKNELLDKLENTSKSLHEVYEIVNRKGPEEQYLADELWFAWYHLEDAIDKIYDEFNPPPQADNMGVEIHTNKH